MSKRGRPYLVLEPGAEPPEPVSDLLRGKLLVKVTVESVSFRPMWGSRRQSRTLSRQQIAYLADVVIDDQLKFLTSAGPSSVLLAGERVVQDGEPVEGEPLDGGPLSQTASQLEDDGRG